MKTRMTNYVLPLHWQAFAPKDGGSLGARGAAKNVSRLFATVIATTSKNHFFFFKMEKSTHSHCEDRKLSYLFTIRIALTLTPEE